MLYIRKFFISTHHLNCYHQMKQTFNLLLKSLKNQFRDSIAPSICYTIPLHMVFQIKYSLISFKFKASGFSLHRQYFHKHKLKFIFLLHIWLLYLLLIILHLIFTPFHLIWQAVKLFYLNLFCLLQNLKCLCSLLNFLFIVRKYRTMF